MRHLSATMSAKNTLWMCVALAAAILAAFLVVVLGTPTKPAEAAFPGKNGKIVFRVHDRNDWEIWTMTANGDNETQLTNNQTNDEDPAFSPTGRKIAFPKYGDILTMSPNGTNQKLVTTSERFDSYPAWSPDGSRIAFASKQSRGSDLYSIRADGSGLTRLTTSPKYDIQPAWSPDGTRIAFRRGNKIHVMKAVRESQTNIPQRLTTANGRSISEWHPAWSPDGTRIAFASDQANADYSASCDIYTIKADGSDQRRLTNLSRGDENEPAWSPDGTKIAFSGKRPRPTGPVQIFVMKAAPESETNRPKALTGRRFNGFEFNAVGPDWQPLR
jgi:Tol biopolymer transport system component